MAASGLASQPSVAACDRGTAAQTIAVDDPRVRSDAQVLPAGRSVAARTLALGIGKTATFADNHLSALNTGVTNAVKRMTVTGPDGRERPAIVQMPHIRPIGDTHPLRLSTRAYLRLAPGSYRVTLTDFFNMSALRSNATYAAPAARTDRSTRRRSSNC